MHSRTHRPRRLVCALLLGGVASIAEAAPPLPAVLRHFGLEPAAARDVRDGEIAVASLDATSTRELAVVAVMIVRAPYERVAAALTAGRSVEVNANVLVHHPLDDPGRPDAFTGVSFAPDETGELADLLTTGPGADFNLSPGELLTFETIGARFDGRRARRSDAARAAASAAYRRLLARRYAAYRRDGLEGMLSYARSDDADDAVHPGADLRAAVEAAGLLARRHPALHRACLRPHESVDGVAQSFAWLKQTVDDRPAFALLHRLSAIEPERGAVVEREFFVGHTYNVLETVTAIERLPEGTLLHHTSRTSTDHVAGLTRSVGRRVGGSRMRDAVVEHLATLRTSIERDRP
jgi:hypothetical protein